MLRKTGKLACAVFLLGSVMAQAGEVSIRAVAFSELPGWKDDDHAKALSVFLKSCDKPRPNKFVPRKDWQELCALAKTGPDPREFFEILFQPVLIEDHKKTLFTGYYEPEINGSRKKQGKYKYPLYKRPPEATPGTKWKTRAQIEAGALSGRGLELAWLADPVENFFLHVQGSGRLKLSDGGVMRVGFNGKNGQKYRSVGREMVRRGLLAAHRVSAQGIKAWVRRNPVAGRSLLQFNPSFVFFRELKGLDPNSGPPGALQVPVTEGRTIAVDDRYTPLGAPVWVDKTGENPMQRLMIAQDVGSAIKGAQRADIYYGSGVAAGKIAGRTKSSGRMYTLLPIETALRLLPEG